MERNTNVCRVDDLCMYFIYITQTKIGVSDSAEPTMVGDEADTGCADCEDEGVVHVQVACQDGCAEVDERSLLACRSRSAGSHPAYGWAFISQTPELDFAIQIFICG